MLLAGVQGYANAISQAQTLSTYNTDSGTPSASVIIKNGNRYALGQGIAAGAQSAQNWWNERAKNSFDYVYVPNVNPTTGRLTKVDIHIEKQIPIDYDENNRKVFYSHKSNDLTTNTLD